MEKELFNDFIKAINKGKNFAIFIHKSPDADAVGSALAIQALLKAKKKECYIYSEDPAPLETKFMFDHFEINDNKISKCDTIICLDMSNASRCGNYSQYIDKTKKQILVLDHHISQDNFGHVVIRDHKMSSTAEIVYFLYKAMEQPITDKVALYIYAGIATDTGCFLHPNTTPSSHRVVADLLLHKFDVKKANFELFVRKPENYTTMIKIVYKNLKIYDNKLTLVVLNNQTYKKLNNMSLFYIVDALSFYTTDIMLLVTEKEKNCIKINARSRTADVQKLCEQFGGGGHKQAAGAEINMKLSTAVKLIKAAVLNSITE